MLPLLGVLVFAIMGIAALSVDAGLAFATQARLAAATPSLAMERARFVEQEIVAGRDPDGANSQWDSRATSLLGALLGQAALAGDASEDAQLNQLAPARLRGEVRVRVLPL